VRINYLSNSQLRPNTPFLTLSIDNSICHLSYFISMQTMPQTLAGIMQIFLKHKILHSSREYMKIHPLLHRIVNYVHDAYVIHGGKGLFIFISVFTQTLILIAISKMTLPNICPTLTWKMEYTIFWPYSLSSNSLTYSTPIPTSRMEYHPQCD
jgi:hypothetical protein